MRARRIFLPSLLGAALGLSLVSTDADAAGLFVTDRGVRPLGRGGAFVAGADDLGAIWYNPAGLADAGTTLLADFSWLHYTSDYTRATQVVDASGTVRTYNYPTVNGSTPVLPIPTLGFSYNFGDKKEYTAALGVVAPYTAIMSYPQTFNGQPSPSRYSLISLDGSALVMTGAYFAYKPIERFRIGMGLLALVGNFDTTVTFSASPPDRLISSPEDPSYDSLSQLKVGPIFAPSASFGMTALPIDHIRLGISGQLPFVINAPATVNVRLPTAVEFDNAYQDGNAAHVRFTLPGIFRAGVEYRTDLSDNQWVRVELAYVCEFWSEHQSIDIRSDNIKLYNVTGFPSPFGIAPITLPRNFVKPSSVRLGGEFSTPKIFKDYRTELRIGVDYDQSAIPEAYVSPLTIDSTKVTAALGGSIHIGKHFRMDAVYAHVFAADVNVSPAEAKVPRVNPVAGNPTATEAINGGQYSARADVLGVGVEYKF